MALLAFRPSRRTSGISARRMAVRPDVPWYWRSLRVVVGVVVVAAVAWGLFGMFISLKKNKT